MPVHLTRIDWTHPLLSALGDSQLADLPPSQFSRYARLAPIHSELGDAILAAFPDGTPAIVESRVGKGRVVLFNTSANDAWGDLPLRRSFVPLIDRLLTHLAARVGQQAFDVGEPVNMPLPSTFNPESVRLVSPSGETTRPPIESRGGRSWLAIPRLEEPGAYRLEPTDGPIAEAVSFAVHVGPGDRVLSAIDSPSLRSWWSPAEVEVIAAEDAAGRFAAEEAPGDWTPWLLASAAALLLAETLYGTWISPLRSPEPGFAASDGGASA